MGSMLLKDMLRLLPAGVTYRAPNEAAWHVPVSHVAFHKDQCRAGSLFFAWQGAHHDGHQFVAEALRRGAVGCVLARAMPDVVCPQIICEQPRRLLGIFGHALVGYPADSMRVVAVTGTSGKTTCAHLVAAILADAHGKSGLMGTLGSTIFKTGQSAPEGALWGTKSALTTPEGSDVAQTLASWRDEDTSAAVLEASSIALDQGRLMGLRCDVGLMTNLTREHLDYHGSMQDYLAAKALLFKDHIKPTGTAVLNADDPWQDALDHPRTLRFSALLPHRQRKKADVFVRRSHLGTHGIDAVIATPGDEVFITSSLMGPFNLSNLVAAVAVGHALGVAPQHITRGLQTLQGVMGRLERVGPTTPVQTPLPLVLVDYAHKPAALAAALSAARALCTKKLWCVFGCGGERDSGKRGEMGRVAAEACEAVVVTNDNPRGEDAEAIAAAIAQGLRKGGAKRCPLEALGGADAPAYAMALDRGAAINAAILSAAPGDVIVIAGKGHETYQQVGHEKRPFDDRVEARFALDRRLRSHQP